MAERQPTPDAAATLATIHRRYLGAAEPAAGEFMSLAYRLRLFSLDRWNCGRAGRGPDGEILDGANKCPESVLNISRLIAAMGSALDGPGFALAEVTA